MKRAFITGITGQDGFYLAQFLLKKGYEVHGMKRRSSSFNTGRIEHLDEQYGKKEGRFFLHYGDLTDATNCIRLIAEIEPHEIYNLGAQSHVAVSFETPEYTAQSDALGTLRLLEGLRIIKQLDRVRFYQASTSELYGTGVQCPQTVETPFAPRSPYGVAKLYAYWITVNYRQAYGLFAVNGILFNHESPYRGHTFVTRKITRAVAHIYHGGNDVLYLGNIDAQRDWGYAGDYVEAMWLMMQHECPCDWIVATGTSYSVRDFVQAAFREIGITIAWRYSGVDEQGYDVATNRVYIRIDKNLFRPSDIDHLQGDSSIIRSKLGWSPRVTFHELVAMMVHSDITSYQKECLSYISTGDATKIYSMHKGG